MCSQIILSLSMFIHPNFNSPLNSLSAKRKGEGCEEGSEEESDESSSDSEKEDAQDNCFVIGGK